MKIIMKTIRILLMHCVIEPLLNYSHDWLMNLSMFYRFVRRSVFTIQHYDDWKPRRRTFDPAFARRYTGCHVQYTIILIIMFLSHLNSLVPQLNKVAMEQIDNLRSRADGETVVDMAKEFGNAALEVISVVSRLVSVIPIFLI